MHANHRVVPKLLSPRDKLLLCLIGRTMMRELYHSHALDFAVPPKSWRKSVCGGNRKVSHSLLRVVSAVPDRRVRIGNLRVLTDIHDGG
jgi:hypothetical protein